MPDREIAASVGRGGVNAPADVTLVQNLLIARGYTAIGTADGVCDDATVAAIVAYQSGFLRQPDGKIDAGGTTWRHLAASFTGSTTTPPPPAAASITKTVPRPAPESINRGLVAVSNDYMLRKLGPPLLNGGYTSQCQVPTQPKLRTCKPSAYTVIGSAASACRPRRGTTIP